MNSGPINHNGCDGQDTWNYSGTKCYYKKAFVKYDHKEALHHSKLTHFSNEGE